MSECCFGDWAGWSRLCKQQLKSSVWDGVGWGGGRGVSHMCRRRRDEILPIPTRCRCGAAEPRRLRETRRPNHKCRRAVGTSVHYSGKATLAAAEMKRTCIVTPPTLEEKRKDPMLPFFVFPLSLFCFFTTGIAGKCQGGVIQMESIKGDKWAHRTRKCAEREKSTCFQSVLDPNKATLRSWSTVIWLFFPKWLIN